jgi:hypothetical protein
MEETVERIIGHLTTLYHLKGLFSVKRREWMITFGELQRIREESILSYLKALRPHSFGRSKENHENLRIFGVPVEIRS